MSDRIAKGLQSQFDRHRIVFWYDAKNEFGDTFDGLALDGVEKIRIDNNEFGMKHRILRGQPDKKFLIFRSGPEPALIDNWLLDVQLAHGVFKTDQTAVWLTELGLGLAFEPVIRSHEEFFRSAKRLDQLKAILKPDDTPRMLRLRMLCVCANAEGGFDTVVEALLAELAEGRDEKMKLINRTGLSKFLWEYMGSVYGYRSENPNISDFAIALFKACYALGTGGTAKLSAEALVFFRRWKNNRNQGEAFERLSAEYAGVLGIADDLANRDLRDVIDIDYFEEVDRSIIRNLVRELSAQTVAHGEALGWVRQRRQSHWYQRYRDIYEAIGYAAEFQQSIAHAKLGMTSLEEGIQRYAETWFRIDQLYRKFIYHMQQSGQPTLLGELFTQVENHYVNSYLLRLNDAWQQQVDKSAQWEASAITPQRAFYHTYVGSFRRKDQRICVIISDALRYEIAEDLLGRVRSLDRYEADIEPMLGSLPSYTQLGMASLLPNTALRIADDDTGLVLVDSQASQGLENRRKILSTGRSGDRSTALKADELLGFNGDDARALLRDHDVIYIYHNRIDAMGDDMTSEDKVFEAAEDTIEELIKIIKKMTAANANNILVTADHGFIYQHRPIEESDFSAAEVAGDRILYRNRRFVLGHGLRPQPGLRKFTSVQAGLQGEIEIQIPKSINRLRQKGSGSRYVHGGAALPEIVVPVLRINKKRQSDVAAVEIDIISPTSRTITSSQVAVVLYQSSPITDKVQPRTLRAAIYAPSGEAISDVHVLRFDYRSENPRERELPVRFLMSKRADDFDEKEVILKLEERHGDTSHYKEYRSARYVLRRRFKNDFDF